MISKALKIGFILISFTFLTGFVQVAALMGPGMTIFSSGNIVKAGAQYLIDHSIKKKTGKNTLTHVGDEIKKIENQNNLDKELRDLVEKRIKEARLKLNLEKVN